MTAHLPAQLGVQGGDLSTRLLHSLGVLSELVGAARILQRDRRLIREQLGDLQVLFLEGALPKAIVDPQASSKRPSPLTLLSCKDCGCPASQPGSKET